MAYQSLLVEKRDGIATLTLNRPDKLNAFTPVMGDELCDAFRGAREDDEVRVVVLTGAGRAFCAGADLDVLKQEEQRARMAKQDFITRLPLELYEYPKPTIAALNGAAIGVGVTMVLPLDIRIAASDAKIGLTFARLGILPGLGSSALLPRLVGPAKALELLLTARVILGEEAREIGLVNATAPAERVLARAHEMAAAMAALDPAVLAHVKQSLAYGAGATLADALANEPKVSRSLAEARQKKGS